MNKDLRGRQTKDGIRIYEDADFAGMRAAGALAAQILDEVAPHVTVGQTTAELDRIINEKVYWIGVWHDNDVWAINTRLLNARISGADPFWNVFEWDVK